MVDLNAWLSEQPRWLQEAARRLYAADELSDGDYEELVELCKQEANGTLDVACEDSGTLPGVEESSAPGSLRLKSIENVVGINALASENELDFGSEPLSIVYGRNGAGKSGYMRILKHACDAKARGDLLPDVFRRQAASQGCRINFDLGDESKQVQWCVSDGPIEELRRVAVFDQACERVYVNQEHETVYEPPELALVRRLVDACGRVNGALTLQQESMPSRLPRVPTEYAETAAGRWLRALRPSTKREDVDRHSGWTAEDSVHLEQLNVRLSGVDPRQRAAEQRSRVRALEALKSLLEDAREGLSDVSYRQLEAARRKAAASRQEAVDGASRAATPVRGVGSDHWRRLWEAARNYSEVEAYPSDPFPVVDATAHCVLCQQPLQSSAVERLISFEAIAKGALEAKASAAEARVRDMIEALPRLPSLEDLHARLDRAGIGAEADRAQITDYLDALRPRSQSFKDGTGRLAPLPPRPGGQMEALQSLLTLARRELQAFEKDAEGTDLGELGRQRAELASQQWLYQQRSAVREEVDRLRAVAALDNARTLTGTNRLSRLATSLSEKLVTQAFGDRFRSELKRFGADYLRVEMVKSRTIKGRVLHRLVLRTDSSHETAAILSDGEKRIVSLAACFADVLAEERDVPFVFDDPMSSLDQEHEERVADRLVELAGTRQVIVFTHRLPFMMALSQSASSRGVKVQVSSLERTPWGAGVPSGSPLHAQRPDRALNQLADERLSAIRKAEEAQNLEGARARRAELCRDLRITLENIVEKVLLADVVTRFRRPINTKGKLRLVARVRVEDCNLVDGMMTRYSFPEHSQPEETPVLALTADELETDLQELIAWLGEFSKRKA